MKTLDNALADILSHYKGLTYDIEPTEDPRQHILTVWNERIPGSYLKIELHDVGGMPAALVIERHNVGRRSMTQFMDRLMDALDD
jgi:hypothetical protein